MDNAQQKAAAYFRRQLDTGRAKKDGIALDFLTIRSDSRDAFVKHVEAAGGEVWINRKARYRTVSGQTRNGYKVVAYVPEDLYMRY